MEPAGSSALSIVGVAAIFLMPLLLVGPPEYPSSDWTRGLLWICVAPIMGFTVQSLVRQLRERAAESLRRAEELQVSQEETRKLVVSMAAVTEATREIARTTDSGVARDVICSATCTITGRALCEADGGESGGRSRHDRELRPPGSASAQDAITGDPTGAVAAFLSKKPLFVSDARGRPESRNRSSRRPARSRCISSPF